MQPKITKPNTVTIDRLRQMVLASFAGRDDLYAAAEALDDKTLSQLCRRLGDENAGHAVELQQRLMAEGEPPVEPDSLETQLQKGVLQVMREQFGDQAVLEDARECEAMLRVHYDAAARDANVPELEEVFERHRDEVEFGERILDVAGDQTSDEKE